jgi:hypothetical protein
LLQAAEPVFRRLLDAAPGTPALADALARCRRGLARASR